MTYIRRLILALALSAGIAPAIAQVPAPVPALPDTERRTSYTITASTCACAVNFALYGDSTDFANWVEVFLNGTRVNYNDATFGWTITSPSGSLSLLARPITDAVLTFTNVQTGTVQIVGARRPRRVSQFSENAGVTARALNQALTDIVAQNREVWDKTNDFTGRALISQPGVSLGLLPLPSVCANGFLGFDATGLIPTCRTSSGPGNVTLPVVSGDLACFNGTAGQMLDCGVPPLSLTLPHTQDFLAGTNFTPGTTTSLTLSSAAISRDLLTIAFDGISQNVNTWLLSGAVVTFNAAIPLNTQVVEAKWQSPASSVTGVSSIGLSGSPLTGAVNLVPGTATKITASGQNITISATLPTTNVINPKDPPYNAVCDGSTDDTAALQAAINAVPQGGTLYIPPSDIYNGTGQYIGGCLFSSTLTANQPINITGGGMYSNLKTAASFPSNQTNLLINQTATYRFGIKFSNFSIGNDVTAVPYTRYGGRGLWVSATGGMSRIRFENLHIGESSNDYSLVIDGAGTQQDIVRDNLIAGGMFFNSTADSQIVEDNVFAGRSTIGIRIDMPGAGQLKFTGNTITNVGGMYISGMSLPNISGNYFEELLGFPTNMNALLGRNAMLALVSNISAADIHANIFNMGQSTSGNPIYINGTNTTVSANIFNNSNNGNAGSIWNLSATLSCVGVNTWNQTVHVAGGGNTGGC